MAEEAEDEEEKNKTPPPLPPLPWDPLFSAPNCRKRLGDLPGLSNCHSCGLHCPPKVQSDNLQTLESQWRVALLCNCCLGRVWSAEACSYCFSKISEEDGGLLDCHECSRRVHIRCVPIERGYVALSDLHPDSFTCIDCCPLPKSHRRSLSVGSRFCLEDLVRDASSTAEKKAAAAACAKEKAQQKALAAMRAAELARDKLDAVVAVKERTSSSNRGMPDEQLALQLHRAMNGSQRVSRNRRPNELDSAIGSKKARVSGNSTGRKAESGGNSVCEKVEFCTDDKAFFDSAEKIWVNHCSSLESDSAEKSDQKKEVDGHSESNLVEINVKEEQGSCYNKVINSVRDDNNIGFVGICCRMPNDSSDTLVLSECGGGARENSSEEQQKKWCTTHGRHKKKYTKNKFSKRHLSSKGMINREETQLVPCRRTSCSKSSRTLPIP